MSLLEVKDLKVSYGGIEALKGISFKVDEGAIVTLIGANGAGKTTLLKLILGQLEPDEGTIQLGTKLQIAGYLTSAYGGMKNFGAIFGTMASLIAAGSGLGPLMAGFIYDSFGNYDPYLWIGIVGTLLSAVLIFGLPGYPEWVKRPHARGVRDE